MGKPKAIRDLESALSQCGPSPDDVTFPCEYSEGIDLDEVASMINGLEFYDKKTAQRIVDLMRIGSPSSTAIRMVGITKDKFLTWREEHPEFDIAVDMAEGNFKHVCEHSVHSAMSNDWKAGAWVLERRYKDEYANKQEAEINMQTAFDMFAESVIGDLEKSGAEAAKETLDRIKKRIS